MAATVRHFLMAVCTKGPCAHTSSLNHAMATCSWTFRRHRAKRKRRKCGGGALPARVSIAVRAGRRCRVHQRTVCCHHLSTSQRGPLPLRLRGTPRLQPSKFVALHWRSQQAFKFGHNADFTWLPEERAAKFRHDACARLLLLRAHSSLRTLARRMDAATKARRARVRRRLNRNRKNAVPTRTLYAPHGTTPTIDGVISAGEYDDVCHTGLELQTSTP